MLLVDSNDDVIFATTESCIKCLEDKMHLTILTNFGAVEGREYQTVKKENKNVKLVNVKCVCG